MMKATTAIFILLFALCSFLAQPSTASENEVWWDSAVKDAERDGYKLIDTKDLAQLLNSDSEAIIIDVRADYEHEAGRIPDSENLEFDLGDRTDITKEKKAAFVELLGENKQRRIVIYCRSFR